MRELNAGCTSYGDIVPQEGRKLKGDYETVSRPRKRKIGRHLDATYAPDGTSYGDSRS
jgi:hypothetical protein